MTSHPGVDRWHAIGPGRLKLGFIRVAVRLLVRAYLRVRVEGAEHIPTDSAYVLCFSHPSWLDPFLLVAFWPDRRRMLFIFGPKEEDMQSGWRNHLINWGGLGVPFKPSKRNLLETTRRAMTVLNAGNALSIAGEGRLSDREGALVPLQDGPAFLALRAGVPIVPVAVIGTRWLAFGRTVSLRIGPLVELAGRHADRSGVASLTADTQAAIERLLTGVPEQPRPGPFGRWLTDVFSERPWLNAPAAGSEPAPPAERR